MNISFSDCLKKVRSVCPLVHHITNYVTVNDCANVTLAIGASPVMADDIGEAADITRLASALVLNIGTLNQRTVETMLASGRAANEKGIPVVFDPVGAGASPLRTHTAERIIREVRLAVIRGNMSEIRCISGLASHTKGVDASEADRTGDADALAAGLAEKTGTVVAITGEVDTVSDGARAIKIENGCPRMAQITGTGCMCTSLTGAFCGANPEHLFEAAAAAVTAMGVCGELAAEGSAGKGNGAFHIALIDAVSLLDGDTLEKRARCHEA